MQVAGLEFGVEGEVTWVWLSAAVENSCDFLAGIGVLRGIRRVKIPAPEQRVEG